MLDLNGNKIEKAFGVFFILTAFALTWGLLTTLLVLGIGSCGFLHTSPSTTFRLLSVAALVVLAAVVGLFAIAKKRLHRLLLMLVIKRVANITTWGITVLTVIYVISGVVLERHLDLSWFFIAAFSWGLYTALLWMISQVMHLIHDSCTCKGGESTNA